MIIPILANGTAVAVSLWLAHRSFVDGLPQAPERNKSL
jgi:hypothetical protein